MTPDAPALPLNRRQALLALAGTAVQLAGCGGGGGNPGSGGGGLGGGVASFATGTLAGLGSIIVGGIRFDSSSAVVSRFDGGFPSAPQLGMVVSVQGSGISAGTANTLPGATATRISYGSEWVGRLGSVTGSTLTLLDSSAQVLPNTVFGGTFTSLAALASATPPVYVEIFGYLNPASGQLVATRVESSTAAPLNSRLSGRVSNLNTLAKTFTLGTATINYSNSTLVPTSWGNGSLVQVELTNLGPPWNATVISLHPSGLDALTIVDNAESVLRGTVTQLNSATSLVVDGVAVDAGQAQFSGSPVVGSLVDITGNFVSGAVVARQVTVRSTSGAGSIGLESFDFIGTAANIDTTNRTFAIAALGLGFTYDPSTTIRAGRWINGETPLVRVKATQVNGLWAATQILSAL